MQIVIFCRLSNEKKKFHFLSATISVIQASFLRIAAIISLTKVSHYYENKQTTADVVVVDVG